MGLVAEDSSMAATGARAAPAWAAMARALATAALAAARSWLWARPSSTSRARAGSSRLRHQGWLGVSPGTARS